MMTTTNEQLAGIRARLHVVWLEATDTLTWAALGVVIEEIVPDMAAMTARWIVPMLRDKSYVASCRGEGAIAGELFSVADALEALDLRCERE